jgi:uncharacterized protein (TIGR02145 family)
MRFTSIVFLIFSIILNSCRKEEVPTVTTSEITNITGTTASSGGIVTNEGTSSVITRGVCWSTSTKPTIADRKTSDGGGAGIFLSYITGLRGGHADYFVRAYATNNEGTGYGLEMLLTTLGQIPLAETQLPTNISSLGVVTLNGAVNPNYLTTNVTFEYGTTVSYGNYIESVQNQLAENGTSSKVYAIVTGLDAGTTYHFRIKAVNSLGTTVGHDITFIPPSPVIDIEGNVYQTVTIGEQTWMAENLKTTKFNNGDLLGTTNPATKDLSGESKPIYQWAYDGDESNVSSYGRLYTWYAANDSRKLCPTGWHFPDFLEWDKLKVYVGRDGGKLKETGLTHWLPSNEGATNESGFTALPGGNRYYWGVFIGKGLEADWWQLAEFSPGCCAFAFGVYSGSRSIGNEGTYWFGEDNGFSIRCLKN